MNAQNAQSNITRHTSNEDEIERGSKIHKKTTTATTATATALEEYWQRKSLLEIFIFIDKFRCTQTIQN